MQILNTTKEAIPYNLRIGDRRAAIAIPANSVRTVRVPLDD